MGQLQGKWEAPFASHNVIQTKCIEGDMAGLVGQGVYRLLLAQKSVEEIRLVRENHYSLNCEVCKRDAHSRFDGGVSWLMDFATSYIRDPAFGKTFNWYIRALGIVNSTTHLR
jgi:hypothetical protein